MTSAVFKFRRCLPICRTGACWKRILICYHFCCRTLHVRISFRGSLIALRITNVKVVAHILFLAAGLSDANIARCRLSKARLQFSRYDLGCCRADLLSFSKTA